MLDAIILDQTMQKNILIFFSLIVTSFSGQAQPPYQIKSCKIVIEFSTGFARGTKTIIFSDSGKIEKQLGTIYFDTSAMSRISKEFKSNKTIAHTLGIQTKDSVFSIDLDARSGTRRSRINLDWLPKTNSEEKKIGENTLLGRKCTITNFGPVKIWYWKGLALKKETPAFIKVYEYASLIDENYIIKDDEFAIPKDIKWQ